MATVKTSAVNTRSTSGDEIANVNFLYDGFVHVLQHTIDSRINSATGRRSSVVRHFLGHY